MKRQWKCNGYRIDAYTIGIRFKYVAWIAANRCVATATLEEMLNVLKALPAKPARIAA